MVDNEPNERDVLNKLLFESGNLGEAQKKEAGIMLRVQELSKLPELGTLLALNILNWRIYQLLHNEFKDKLKKHDVTEEEMAFFMQAISHGAMKPFKVGRMKNDVKRLLIPFLKSQATKVAKKLEEKPGDGDSESESDGGAKTGGPRIIIP
jgi:hypothetical protein